MAKKKATRGGARQGAGRPPSKIPVKLRGYMLTDVQIRFVERYAKRNNLDSNSQALREIIDKFRKQKG